MAANRLIQMLSNPLLGGQLRYCSTLSLVRLKSTVTNVQADEEEEEKIIWKGYKRNFKGAIPPQKTRLRCKRQARRHTVGSPCPICRDDIEIKYTDVKLLKQFICPHTDDILPTSITGLCRLQQKKMIEAINQARDYGLMTFTIPKEFEKESEPELIPPWNRINITNDDDY